MAFAITIGCVIAASKGRTGKQATNKELTNRKTDRSAINFIHIVRTIVVYCCFFAEIGQAMMQSCDVTLRAF